MFPGLYCPGLIEEGGHSTPPSRASQCFRGSIAPASLKAGLSTAVAPAGSLCFRGSIAPASLKAVEFRGDFGRQRGVFPGLYCPGLIEGAMLSLRLCAIPTPCFRGSIAPASLKATFLIVIFTVLTGCFRGSIAPASLKVESARDITVAQTTCFRGSIAPASLKGACVDR